MTEPSISINRKAKIRLLKLNKLKNYSCNLDR